MGIVTMQSIVALKVNVTALAVSPLWLSEKVDESAAVGILNAIKHAKTISVDTPNAALSPSKIAATSVGTARRLYAMTIYALLFANSEASLISPSFIPKIIIEMGITKPLR